jgi:hypothetical protein
VTSLTALAAAVPGNPALLLLECVLTVLVHASAGAINHCILISALMYCGIMVLPV